MPATRMLQGKTASADAYVALNEQVAEVKRMLYRFMQSLNLGRAEG